MAIAVLTTGAATEAFTPLFGQRLAGLEPLVAGSAACWSTSERHRPSAPLKYLLLGLAVVAGGGCVAAHRANQASATQQHSDR